MAFLKFKKLGWQIKSIKDIWYQKHYLDIKFVSIRKFIDKVVLEKVLWRILYWSNLFHEIQVYDCLFSIMKQVS